MKKLTIASLLAVMAFNINAQILPEDDKDNMRNNLSLSEKFQKHLAANHITGVKAYSYSKKHPEGVVRYDIKYDSHGNTVDYASYKKNGKMSSDWKYQYDDNNKRVSQTVFYKKDKPNWGGFWRYDKAGNMVQNWFWDKDTATHTFKWVITYDANNNPKESSSYSWKGKLYSRSVYEYYDDGSKKKTTTYDRKGKVVGVWNYDCNPIGKSQESKMKDTSKICVHIETDKNGNPIKVKEDYTREGWLFSHRVRKITKYDKDNHVIAYITTKMSGKEISNYSADFDAQGNLTEARDMKPNTKNVQKRLVYTYDNTGNMTQLTVFKNSSKEGDVYKYVYNQ